LLDDRCRDGNRGELVPQIMQSGTIPQPGSGGDGQAAWLVDPQRDVVTIGFQVGLLNIDADRQGQTLVSL
jgi:hypothetical protein